MAQYIIPVLDYTLQLKRFQINVKNSYMYLALVRVLSSYLIRLGGDGCLVEIATRLRQDATVQGGICLEINGGLGQKDALHVRISFHHDCARDLPEDVLFPWHCGCDTGRVRGVLRVHQGHYRVRVLQQVPRNLNDEDIFV
jgi:hypothetical protein